MSKDETKVTYDELLANAPDHNSDAFIEYIRINNKVVYDDGYSIVIENYKYHTPDKPWYTAFFTDTLTDYMGMDSAMALHKYNFPQMHLLLKARDKRSVKRFHVHFISEV